MLLEMASPEATASLYYYPFRPEALIFSFNIVRLLVGKLVRIALKLLVLSLLAFHSVVSVCCEY